MLKSTNPEEVFTIGLNWKGKFFFKLILTFFFTLFQYSTLPQLTDFVYKKDLDYDFQLERQTLCTMKSSASKNPFFK